MTVEPETQRKGPNKSVLPLLAIAALAVGLMAGLQFFTETQTSPVQLSGTALSPPRPLTAFTLTDHRNKPFTLESFKDHWTFVAFGYTHCPDVCPTLLATYKGVAEQLATRRLPAQFVFVSVDPERDSLQRLGEYVTYFDQRIVGVSGNHEALQGLTKQLGVLYAKAEGENTALGYLVDHTASIVLIDPQGALAAIFSTPHDIAAMARDFAYISKQR